MKGISWTGVMRYFLAWGAMILLSPFILILSLLVWVTSGWPVFFLQDRIGLKGRVFKIIKFRTMKVGAETEKENLLALNEADGPAFKIKNDPRCTKMGIHLFRTGLDEMPQIINVVRGEMAMVGPRPLPVSEARQIEKKYRKIRELVKPGIISPWLFDGYHKLSFREWMESDCDYVKKKSFGYDFALVIRSVGLMWKLVWKELIS